MPREGNRIYGIQGIFRMFSRTTITREKLYNAVWTGPVQKVARTLGLLDVGLAKIAKKLQIPVSGHGYWAKGPMERKLLKGT